jgi:hypothetical protein
MTPLAKNLRAVMARRGKSSTLQAAIRSRTKRDLERLFFVHKNRRNNPPLLIRLRLLRGGFIKRAPLHSSQKIAQKQKGRPRGRPLQSEDGANLQDLLSRVRPACRAGRSNAKLQVRTGKKLEVSIRAGECS